jgi:uncharacterized repeat protein (TIGR03803 family)
MIRKLIFVLLIALSCRRLGAAGQGPVYRLLYSPPLGSNIGALNDIFEVKPGLFYIMSFWTGGGLGGSVISVSSAGAFNIVYSFPQQVTMGWVVQATNETLYGSGYTGIPPTGSNFYFSLDPSGKHLEQHPIPSPWEPGFETLVVPPNQLYDFLGQVTSSNPIWAFAKVSESGDVTILYQLTSSDGGPQGSNRMVLGPDGNMYGIGVQSPSGITPTFIYRFTPSGTYSRIFTFPFNPGYDLPLIAASDGNLYGSISRGGTNNTGQIYQVTLAGHYQVMASFPASVVSPRTLMQAADGNLYGTNNNQIFRYNLTTHAVTLMYQMNVGGSQGACPCELVEGMDGKLYGAAQNGGNYPGSGAVFSLGIGLPKPLPAISGLYPAKGAVGQKIILWGNYLLGVKSVSFNGILAASPASTSVQSVAVTVPAGATTGPITVTTGNGSFTTAQSFTVQ